MLSDSIWKDILKLQRQTFSVFTVSKMHILKTILIAWVTVLDLYMVHSDVIWNYISELQREMKICFTQEYCKFRKQRHYKLCIKLILTLFETYGWRHLCSPVPLYPRTPFFLFSAFMESVVWTQTCSNHSSRINIWFNLQYHSRFKFKKPPFQ